MRPSPRCVCSTGCPFGVGRRLKNTPETHFREAPCFRLCRRSSANLSTTLLFRSTNAPSSTATDAQNNGWSPARTASLPLETRSTSKDTPSTRDTPGPPQNSSGSPPPGALTPAQVPSDTAGILLIDGQPSWWLETGHYLLWQLRAKVELQMIDLYSPTLDLSEHHYKMAPPHVQSIILENHEAALLSLDGVPVQWLTSGKHYVHTENRKMNLQRVNLHKGHTPWSPALSAFAPPELYEEVTIEPHEAAFLRIDQQPLYWLSPGRYLLWKEPHAVECIRFDLRVPCVDLPEELQKIAPSASLHTLILGEHERALLTVNGKPHAWLASGRHCIWQSWHTIHVNRIDIRPGYYKHLNEIDAVIPQGEANTVHVASDEIAIVIRDQHPKACLTAGRYHLWQARERVSIQKFPTNVVRTKLPELYWPLIPEHLMSIYTVHPYERGVLYVNGELHEVLPAGRHAFHSAQHQIEVRMVDLREKSLKISGQEIISADKVSLRVNLIVKYKVVDALQSVESQTELHDALYAEAQLASRRYIAGLSVDEMLEGRNEVNHIMLQQMAKRVETWGIEVTQIDLKDVILPGEMKNLLNRVIEAEKQAAANAILRKEEASAARTQLNIARALKNNPSLMRLKELELLKEAANNVGHLTVIAGGEQLLHHLAPAHHKT